MSQAIIALWETEKHIVGKTERNTMGMAEGNIVGKAVALPEKAF